MKKLILSLLVFLTVFTAVGQNIVGQWNGILKIQGTQLRIVFNIDKEPAGFISTMDSPDQGTKGIPVSSTTFEELKLKLEIPSTGIEYAGEYKADSISGIFRQAGLELPLDLFREQVEKQVLSRPQDPIQPYEYHSEEVIFRNTQAKITLSGTLTSPKGEGKYPAVILISGSGPQNRDEEILGHRPFLVISDYLTRNGIAVLRYDDRGFGKSSGDFWTSTSEDFASDVTSAIEYLKMREEINPDKIGLVGHSEGGMIAPMVAANSQDVGFIVLLAGTGIRGDKLLLLQGEFTARVSGISEADIQKLKSINAKAFEIVLKSRNAQISRQALAEYMEEILQRDPSVGKLRGIFQVDQFSNPWMEYFVKHDPAIALEKVKCPVLALNGEKDVQVPPKENLGAICNALGKGGNDKVTIKELQNLNHLFQNCNTGSPYEYAVIEQTFSPEALQEITRWIIVQTK